MELTSLIAYSTFTPLFLIKSHVFKESPFLYGAFASEKLVPGPGENPECHESVLAIPLPC